MLDGEALGRGAQALGDDPRGVEIRRREQHPELFATQPTHDVERARPLLQGGSQGDEDGVAAGVLPAYATAPALLFVACLMLRDLGDIEWGDTTESIPAAITALVIPFTYSIAEGIAFGFITYAALKLTTGRAREVKPVVWVIAALFIFKIVYIGT